MPMTNFFCCLFIKPLTSVSGGRWNEGRWNMLFCCFFICCSPRNRREAHLAVLPVLHVAQYEEKNCHCMFFADCKKQWIVFNLNACHSTKVNQCVHLCVKFILLSITLDYSICVVQVRVILGRENRVLLTSRKRHCFTVKSDRSLFPCGSDLAMQLETKTNSENQWYKNLSFEGYVLWKR